MKRLFSFFAAITVAATVLSGAAYAADKSMIKTRLDHLSGTPLVLVISYLPAEITSITCEKWTMLGIGSYKGHNDFTIPAGPAIAVMDASKFDGYCAAAGSITRTAKDTDEVRRSDLTRVSHRAGTFRAGTFSRPTLRRIQSRQGGYP